MRKPTPEQRAEADRIGKAAKPLDPTTIEWTTPVPLGEATQNPFPIESLPPLLRTAVEHVATTRAVHPVLPFTGYLGGISGVFAEGLTVAITASWVEPVNLYVFAVAGSGDGKTPAFKPSFALVDQVEQERRKSFEEEAADAKARLVMIPDELKAARKAGDFAAVRLLVVEQEEAQATLRRSGRITVQDATPEATAALMGRNDGLLVINDAEGSIIHHALGMYSDTPNIALWLAGWSGEAYHRDRVREEGAGEVLVPSARIGIGAAIQPGVLQALLRDPRVHDRGFLSRALCAWPSSSAGSRRLDAIEDHPKDANYLDPLHKRVLDRWRTYRDSPTPFSLDKSARRDFIEWHDEQEDLMQATDESGQQHIPKVRTSVARMAAIFHALTDASTVIGSRSMRDAITVGSWYLDGREVNIEQALLADARQVLAWLGQQKVATTTVREACRGVGWYKYRGGTERTISALGVLAEHGWVVARDQREGFGTVGRRGGKASPVVLVHPEVGAGVPIGPGVPTPVVTGEQSIASLQTHEGGRDTGATGDTARPRRRLRKTRARTAEALPPKRVPSKRVSRSNVVPIRERW